VTATDATEPGFVTVYPAATNQPLASNLNVDHPGQTIPNHTVARLGYQGRVSTYSLTDVQLLFDVAGWFTGDLTPPDPGVPLSPPTPPSPSTPTTTPPATAPTTSTSTTTTTMPSGPPARPPPSASVNCSDFPNWAAANAWFQYWYPVYGDIAGLDSNHDGVPCESLPGAP
jgi:hypothetical protein